MPPERSLGMERGGGGGGSSRSGRSSGSAGSSRRAVPINERKVTATTSKPNVPYRAKKILDNMRRFGPGGEGRARKSSESEAAGVNKGSSTSHDQSRAWRKGGAQLRLVPTEIAPMEVEDDEEDMPPSGQTSVASGSTSATHATHASGSSSRVAVPNVPLYSSAAARQTRSLISKEGLKRADNPLTHHEALGSGSALKTMHYNSSSTGHQVADRMGNAAGANSWWATRIAKLKDQSADRESDLLSTCIIYVNGFTGDGTTRQEIVRLVQSHGAKVCIMPSGSTTHVLSAAPLSAKKTQELLNRKVGAKGPKLVKVEWALDSIERAKRQPEHKYAWQSETQRTIADLLGGAKKAGTSSEAVNEASKKQEEQPSRDGWRSASAWRTRT